jgi:hypothetical protein
MTTPHTAVSITQTFESAQGYKALAARFRQVQSDLKYDVPDPTDTFGDDEYGRKAIPNIVQGMKEGDDVFNGAIDIVGGAGDNLERTAQSFDNANNVNEGLANKSSFHPNP